MSKVGKVLIVGGGIGGMAAGIALRDAGIQVDLIDLDPNWRVYGAGITITGVTLRAYKHLGMIDDIKIHGAIMNGSRLSRFDGVFLHDLDEPALEEGVPATGGILRPVLHHLMQQRLKAKGASVRLGITVDALVEGSDGVEVTFSDGTKGVWDVVVGSDSVASKVRALAFPHMQAPVETGQGCWRVTAARPPGFERGEFFMGHRYPAGITACSAGNVYLWLLTPHTPGTWVPEEEMFDRMREHLADFGGNAGWIRDHMQPTDWVNYRPLAAILQPRPWNTGRIVLLGDAVHATTPHLASGAGMAVESAIVLAEELARPDRSIGEALDAYTERRYPRCEIVVSTSIAVGKLQLAGARPDEVGKLIGGGLHRLAVPY